MLRVLTFAGIAVAALIALWLVLDSGQDQAPGAAQTPSVQTLAADAPPVAPVNTESLAAEPLGDLTPEDTTAAIRQRFSEPAANQFRQLLANGLPPLDNVQWFETANSSGMLADTTLFNGVPVQVLIHLLDPDDAASPLVVGFRTEALTLNDVLPVTPSANIQLPSLIITAVPDNLDAPALVFKEQAAIVRNFYNPFGLPDDQLTFQPGTHFTTALPLSFLPKVVQTTFGVDSYARVIAQGQLEGPLSAPDRFIVNAQAPIGRPDTSRFPDWLGSPAIQALRIQLEATDLATNARLFSTLSARIRGNNRRFNTVSLIPIGAASNQLSLHLNSAEQWQAPFGIDGLVLENLGGELQLGSQGFDSRLSGQFAFGDRLAGVTLALSPSGEVAASASLDKAGLADLRELAGRLGLGAVLDEVRLPEGVTELRDVELSFAPGAGLFATGKTVLTRDLDGPRRFDVLVQLAAGGDTAGVSVAGQLQDPWVAPYGVNWLNLRDVRLALDSKAQGQVLARALVGKTQVGFQIDTTATGAQFVGSAAKFSFDDLTMLLQQALGFNPLAALADTPVAQQYFNDVTLQIAAGQRKALSIGARTRFKGQQANFLVSAVRGTTGWQSVAGFRFDSLQLGQLVPALKGSTADDLKFDRAAVLVAAAAGQLSGADLGSTERAFYAGLLPSQGTQGLQLRYQSGLTFVASLPVDEGSFLHGPLGVMGSPQEQLFVAGSIPSPFAAGGSLDLAASLPPMRPDFGGSGRPPEWFRYGQLAFVVRLPTNAALSKLQVGLEGSLGVFIDDQDMDFIVGGSFSGTPMAITLRGGLKTDEPWEQPFGVGWLTLEKVGAQVGVNPAGLSLGFTGHMDIGSKNIGVDVLLGLSPTGLPNNFAFMGTSTTSFGMGDILALQNQIAAAAMADGKSRNAPDLRPLLEQLPQLDVRPINSSAPMEARFALLGYESELINIPQGLALSGALFGALNAKQQAVSLAQIRASVGFEGVELESSVNQDVVIADLKLSDAYLKLDVDSYPPGASLVTTGDLRTPWFNKRIDVAIGAKANISAALKQVVAILNAIGSFTSKLVSEPVDALKHAVTSPKGMFALAGVRAPAWMDDVFHGVQALQGHSKGVSPKALLNDVLIGRSITVPAGAGFPKSGRAPRGCKNLLHKLDNGRCWSKRPITGTPLARVQQCVTSGGSTLVNGTCYLVPPGTESNVPRLKTCKTLLGKKRCVDLGCPLGHKARGGRCVAPIAAVRAPNPKPTSLCFGIEKNGQCWQLGKVPRVGQPLGGVEPVCPITQKFFVNGKCWTIPPTPKVTTGKLPGLCSVVGIPCKGDVVGNLGNHLVGLLKGSVDDLTKPFEAKR